MGPYSRIKAKCPYKGVQSLNLIFTSTPGLLESSPRSTTCHTTGVAAQFYTAGCVLAHLLSLRSSWRADCGKLTVIRKSGHQPDYAVF